MAQWFFVSFGFHAMRSTTAYRQGFVKIEPDTIRSVDDFNGFIQREFELEKISKPGTPDRYGSVTIKMLSCVAAVSGLYHAQFESSVMNRKNQSCSALVYIDFNEISKVQQVKDLLMDDYNRRNPSPYNIDKRDGCFITSLSRLS